MGIAWGQLGIVDALWPAKTRQSHAAHFRRLGVSLPTETILVTVVAILAVRISVSQYFGGAAWFAAPAILIIAALVPAAIRGNKLAGLGLNLEQVGTSLRVVFWTCIVFFPATFCGLWAVKVCGFGLPLRPGLMEDQSVFNWLCYQFMYVAVAEEVFFRGYVQNNILRMMTIAAPARHRRSRWISIVLSAACFAAAHIIIQGQVISIVTFLPGLVIGWLFVRTRSLLAPILFHGLANAGYLAMADVLI
jgi:membrane protease YdiL (CAAX protease family)